MRQMHLRTCVWVGIILLMPARALAETRYFGHEARADGHGVIAPWYAGLNGQCDLRVRIAAETLKRYPWTSGKDGKPLPDYIYSGRWSIAPDGTIAPGELKDWGNGDLVQRGSYAIFGLVRYYAYSGDPAAIAHVCMIADAMLDRCRTGPDHAWPDFIISVPNAGEPYGPCRPEGMIQLDLAALAGSAMVQAHQLTGDVRYFQAARHWADLFAAKCDRTPGESPWNRYANPQDVHWNDRQTGGAVLVVRFLDEVIAVEQARASLASARDEEGGQDARPPKQGPDAVGRGTEECGQDARPPRSGRASGDAFASGGTDAGLAELLAARDAGRAYVCDVLLPRWYVDDTWGRDYWDWEHPVQSESLSEFVPRYFMQHQDAFANWTVDCRNILSLYHARACVSPLSNGGVYHGAWAYPEGSQCCERSLSYPPMQIGAALAELGVRTNDPWAREMARRQLILATYDARETGVVEDNMDGGQAVAGGWFQISHPLPLNYVLDAMGWLPETLGANRENHILRSASIVQGVTYAPGRVVYGTSDALADGVDVLRLSFTPKRVFTERGELPGPGLGEGSGYAVEPLPNGDCIVTVRRRGQHTVIVEGDDPARRFEEGSFAYEGAWSSEESKSVSDRSERVARDRGAAVTFEFEGNQVRVIGSTDDDGGLADVYLDGAKQLCGIDYWNPLPRRTGGVVWYRNGLAPGRHVLKIVARGEGNPLSKGKRVSIDAIDCSTAGGEAGCGEGGGPGGPQRWIFGYTGREDYIDSQGQVWRPATEVVIRLGHVADAVSAWYVEPRRLTVAGTPDPMLYRHGMHGKDFTAYATVAPGAYHVRLRFMEHRWNVEPAQRSVDVSINGRPVVEDMDIAATAAGRTHVLRQVAPNATRMYDGLNRAVDLVFNGIEPRQGVIAVRFQGNNGGEAVVSAMEVGPGDAPPGAVPVSAPATQVAQ